ncbi:MAG TPA: PIN domain-containing protein [Labilithrix sp.]|nr:PIN domain-containing protein [Labilithrix sp.]
MKFLLDTSIVSLVARKSKAATKRYERHLDDCALPSIVWHELHCGIQRMKAGAIKSQFLAFYETLLQPVLPYDKAAAAYHAEERARLKSCPSADARIAAIAVTQELILVTANVRDFKSFRGIRLEDWSR